MDIVNDVKEVILNLSIRIHRLECGRGGKPEIHINEGDIESQDAKPAQDGLQMPRISVCEANREEESSMFIPDGTFPTFRSGRLIFVQMQGGDGFLGIEVLDKLAHGW